MIGRRPKVRGVAINPVDHPIGGGEGKASGGRPSVSPQGWHTKGRRTVRKLKKLFNVYWASYVVAIVNGCNPFLVKDRWFESSLAQYYELCQRGGIGLRGGFRCHVLWIAGSSPVVGNL